MEKTIKGKLGVNKEQLISLLGSTMYKAEVCSVAVKELVQNSFDAIKIAQLHCADEDYEICVSSNPYERTIKVSDNGIGMTPEIVQKAFFTIGGSYKGENVPNHLKSGGLGLAKMAFLFSSEHIHVETVHDGILTEVLTTPEEIQSDNFNIHVSRTSKSNGTSVEVKIPETYIDNNGEVQSIYFDSKPSFLDKPMIGNVNMRIGGMSVSKASLPDRWLYIGKATSAFGDIDMYIAPKERRRGSYLGCSVLISGLYQFNWSPYISEDCGIEVVMNILPSVGVRDSLYPINNQREGFRAAVEAETKDLKELLKMINNAFLKGKYAASFSSSMSMDIATIDMPKRIPYDGEILKAAITEVCGNINVTTDKDFKPLVIKMSKLHEELKSRKSTLDTSGINVPKTGTIDISGMSLDKPVFHNNTTLRLCENAKAFLKKLGVMLIQLKSLHLQAYTGKVRPRTSKIWNNSTSLTERESSQFIGISIDKGYGGVNVSPSLFNFIGINPFYYEIPEWSSVDQALYITECLVHAIIHEFNHNYEGGEGENFTGSLVLTEAEFSAIGQSYKNWKNSLYVLVKDNLALIRDYHAKYKMASNTGESLG